MTVEALCTRAQVKARGNISGVSSDNLIDSLIGLAARRLNVATGREFMPQVTETRTFDVDRYLVQLHGCDLRTATTVTLHPENVSESQVLVSGTDYAIELDRLTGSTDLLRLSGSLDLASAYAANFGHARISIAGGWGIWGDVADVAADINEAAIECVLSWVDKATSAAAGYDPAAPAAGLPSFVGSWDIPSSAYRKVQPYSRVLGVY